MLRVERERGHVVGRLLDGPERVRAEPTLQRVRERQRIVLYVYWDRDRKREGSGLTLLGGQEIMDVSIVLDRRWKVRRIKLTSGSSRER